MTRGKSLKGEGGGAIVGSVYNTFDRRKREALSIGGMDGCSSNLHGIQIEVSGDFPSPPNQAGHVRSSVHHTQKERVSLILFSFPVIRIPGAFYRFGATKRNDLSEASMSLRDRFVPSKDLLILSSSDHTRRLLVSRYAIPFVCARILRQGDKDTRRNRSRLKNRTYQPCHASTFGPTVS